MQKLHPVTKKYIITGLMDPNGVWQGEEHKIEEIVINHYRELFCSTRPSDFSKLLAAIQPRVSESMNQMLNRTFQGIEVYSALKQMYSLKASGPDGMSPLFVQHFWPSIGNLVTKTVLDF